MKGIAYEEIPKSLSLLRLEKRCSMGDMIMVYKILMVKKK